MVKRVRFIRRSVLYWITDEDEAERKRKNAVKAKRLHKLPKHIRVLENIGEDEATMFLYDQEVEDDDGALRHPSGPVYKKDVSGKHRYDEEDPLPGKHHDYIDLDDVVMAYGVPQSIFMSFLRQEHERAESCQSLPFTLLLVVSYTLLATNHELAPLVNAVEDSIAHHIEDNANYAIFENEGYKGLQDVNSHVDFWSWMTSGLLPALWQQSYSLAEGRNFSEPYVQQATEIFQRRNRGVLLNYNRLILGVKLSQERDTEGVERRRGGDIGKCQHELLQPMYDKDCIGGRGYELEPETWDARQMKEPTRKTWLYIHDDYEYIREQLVAMEKENWLDADTRKIEILFPIYNGEFGLHSMFMVVFFFSRGGHIWKDIIPLSAFAQNWQSYRSMAYDAVWFACVAWIFVTECKEVKEALRLHGPKEFMFYYAGFWNLIDWASICTAFMIVIMFFVNFNYINSMNTSLERLGQTDEVHNRFWYRKLGKIYVGDLENEVQLAYIFRLVLAAWPAIITLRLFKAFNTLPRLAVVTRTIQTAIDDLFHFMIIFSSVFITYAISAVCFLGKKASDFTTVFRSVIACFRLLFLDFDWDELIAVGRLDAFLWFLPFVLLVVIVLMNMLIAIVMDAYDSVVTDLEGEETTFEMLMKAAKKKYLVHRKKELDIHEILSGMHLKHQAERKLKMEMSLDADEHDLTGEIDSDSDDGGAAARISGRFRKKVKKKRSTLNVEKEPNVTVNMLKTLFPNGKIKGPQAREVIGDAVLHYYQMNGQSGDINDILKSIHETAGMIRGLHKKYKKQEKERGYAQDNIPKVFHMAHKVHSDIESLHRDVGIWMARDESEIPIPKKWLVPCRVKILHHNVSEREWLSQHMDNLRKTLRDLERQSVEVKQVVKECVHGLQVLGDEVQTLRAEKNWALEKYQQYRKHSIALHRKNVEEMESIKETLAGIIEVEEEVDYFTKVSQRLLVDNAELKALAEEDVKVVEHIPSSAGGSKASLFSAAI